jgi:hypothetical protein
MTPDRFARHHRDGRVTKWTVGICVIVFAVLCALISGGPAGLIPGIAGGAILGMLLSVMGISAGRLAEAKGMSYRAGVALFGCVPFFHVFLLSRPHRCVKCRTEIESSPNQTTLFPEPELCPRCASGGEGRTLTPWQSIC